MGIFLRKSSTCPIHHFPHGHPHPALQCHLLSHTADHLVLHLTDQGTPFALDYFVQPTPHDGSCLDSVSLDALTLPTFSNTTVSLRLSGFPPQ